MRARLRHVVPSPGAGSGVMTARTRRRAGIALVVVAAVLLAATAVCGYVRSALVDEHQFSARATSALENPDVRSVVAERVVDGLTRNVVPDVLAVRPLVVPAVAAGGQTTPLPGGVFPGAPGPPPPPPHRD